MAAMAVSATESRFSSFGFLELWSQVFGQKDGPAPDAGRQALTDSSACSMTAAL